ncbi:unnamed protein product [Boreogadus saida]
MLPSAPLVVGAAEDQTMTWLIQEDEVCPRHPSPQHPGIFWNLPYKADVPGPTRCFKYITVHKDILSAVQNVNWDK